MPVEPSRNQIFLRNLHFEALIGGTAWGKSKKQPIVVSIRLWRDFSEARNDDIKHTLSYSTICKQVLEAARTITQNDNVHVSELEFHYTIHQLAIKAQWGSGKLLIETTLPKAILMSDSGSAACTESTAQGNLRRMTLVAKSVRDLKVPCIIGVNDYERERKQMVHINFYYVGSRSAVPMAGIVSNVVGNSSFKTLEALAYKICDAAEHFGVPQFTVSVEKPSAIDAVDGSGVEVTSHMGEDFNPTTWIVSANDPMSLEWSMA